MRLQKHGSQRRPTGPEVWNQEPPTRLSSVARQHTEAAGPGSWPGISVILRYLSEVFEDAEIIISDRDSAIDIDNPHRRLSFERGAGHPVSPHDIR